MPQHRRSQKLPQRLLGRVRSSPSSPFGRIHTIRGGGLRGSRCGFIRPLLNDGGKPRIGAPMDVQYSLDGGILTRTEFVRGEPSIPIHMAHFDATTGRRFSTVIDRFA